MKNILLLAFGIIILGGCENIRWTEHNKSSTYSFGNEVVTTNIISRSGYSDSAIYDCLPVVKIYWNNIEYLVHEGWIHELQISIFNDGRKLLVVEKVPKWENNEVFIKFGDDIIPVRYGINTFVFKCMIDKDLGTIVNMAGLAISKRANVSDLIFVGLPQKFTIDGNSNNIDITSWRIIQ